MKSIAITIAAFVGALAVTGVASAATLPPPSSYFGVTVTAADVTAAGFTRVSIAYPTVNRFQPPQYYFWVHERVATSTGWGDASNVVSVFVRPISDSTWKYNGGQMLILDQSGRTQVNVSEPGYFISIDGPDKTKVTALANALLKRLAK